MTESITIILSLKALAYASGAVLGLFALPLLFVAWKLGRIAAGLEHAAWRLGDLADDVERANEGIERIKGLMGPVPDDDEEGDSGS